MSNHNIRKSAFPRCSDITDVQDTSQRHSGRVYSREQSLWETFQVETTKEEPGVATARWGHISQGEAWGPGAGHRLMLCLPPHLKQRLLNIYSIHTIVSFTKSDRDELMDSASLLGWLSLCSSLACCLLDLTCSKFCLSWHCQQFL